LQQENSVYFIFRHYNLFVRLSFLKKLKLYLKNKSKKLKQNSSSKYRMNENIQYLVKIYRNEFARKNYSFL